MLNLINTTVRYRGKSSLLLILSFFLLTSSFFVAAQPQPGINQQPVHGKALDPRTRISIITVTEEDMFPRPWLAPPIKARANNLSRREMQRSLAALSDAMGKYPESYLRDNIKRVYLLSSLTLYGVLCDGAVSPDALYIVNRGGEEYSDEYIGLIFHHAFSTLSLEKSRRANGYETSDIMRLLPQRRTVGLPSADRVMKKVYEGDQARQDYIYALEKTGFMGVTLLKQFGNLPPVSAIKCPLRCREIRRSAPVSLRDTIKDHLFAFRWTIEDNTPVWSHDGKRIAFQSGRDNSVGELYVMDLDGSNIRRLTHTAYSPYQTTGFSPSIWSPDDQQLAYVMHPGGPSKLFVVNTDGTNLRQLSVENGTSGIKLLGWLSDRRILFLAEGQDKTRTIYSILPDGTGLTPLTEKRLVVGEALLSPNQALLAITANGNLIIKDLKTNMLLESPNDVGVNDFSWSPDSKQIAYGTGGSLIIKDLESGTFRHGNTSIQQLLGAAGKINLRLPLRVFRISWSPDGKQIAYCVKSSIIQNSESPTELHAVNVDGTGPRRLATGGFLSVWSPDARYVVFSRLGAGLYLVRADGSNERYLASGTYPKWIR